ncbi:acetate uptake transporter [Pseudonocardia adelaidensis]|uniref:acetate uptake transporter n=1 Tax=Pseudonocardia adelaidensis TaxID=648754 RepID=UPI0031EA6BEB
MPRQREPEAGPPSAPGPEAPPTRIEPTPVADPAGLGLAAFALTTFLLSAVNAGWTAAAVWVAFAAAYGGLVQLLAGMWEFRNRNVFGAVAFSTYGGFWLGMAFFARLIEPTLAPGQAAVNIGWILIAFAIFNTYMLFWSTQVNTAVFLVFLTLEATEIVLAVAALAGVAVLTVVGGYLGVLTALVAWYTSAAIVIKGTAGRTILPVGGKIFDLSPMARPPAATRAGQPLPQ